MKRLLQQKMPAYFTVEAAMIMTMVLNVLMILIYIMFFQYNRCLLEQDMGALALKGCTVQAESKEELLQTLKQYESQLYLEKYIVWEHGEVSLELKQDSIKVEQTGNLIFPFAWEGVFDMESQWDTKAVYENKRISPVTFIRNYAKLTGGK